jgi:hypothetical protein
VKGARGIREGTEIGDGDEGAQVVEAEFTHVRNLSFLNSWFHLFIWSYF